MSEGSLRYDPQYWHNIQTPEEMDVVRHFEYDEDALFLLRKWLRLGERIPKTIVEIGCGSGYLTEKLLKMASALKEIVAIEPDDALRGYAEEKLSPKVKFLKGTAEDIPLPEEYADLTVCHIVLHNLPNVHGAVSEMVRVTKSGGFVAAIEPAIGGINYYPDSRLNELEEKIGKAFGDAIWDLRCKTMEYPKDWKPKKERYAEVYHSCGLIDVEAHGILSVFLLSDPRREQKEIVSWLKKRLLLHENDWERTRTILQRGGLSQSLIQEYYQARKTYLENLINNPEKIADTHELQIISRTLTIGLKP
jgi:ubiquinone/menaquinone biosynthesis C-methylase UbiE